MKTEPGKEESGIILAKGHPALFTLDDILNGPPGKGKMDLARRICKLAIQERLEDRLIILNYRTSFLVKWGRSIRNFYRGFKEGFKSAFPGT